LRGETCSTEIVGSLTEMGETLMLDVHVSNDTISMGRRLKIAFHRTLRIPDDGRIYPLPPGLGRLPILRVADYADRVPLSWVPEGGAFIPMYRREAMWIGFTGTDWKPNAVTVQVGGVNAVTGSTAAGVGRLAEPQNYLVCPPQVWLDGIKTGENVIRQFVAMPLGEDYTIEASVTGKESLGGLRISVFEPKPHLFPDAAPEKPPGGAERMSFAKPRSASEMGFGAGGTMRQKHGPVWLAGLG